MSDPLVTLALSLSITAGPEPMTATTLSSLEEARPRFIKKLPSGKLEVTLAFEVICYFRGSAAEHWPGIRAFYDVVLPLIRERVGFYVVDGRAGGHAIDGDAFELLPGWASGQEPRQIYGLTLHAGATEGEACDTAFEFYSSGMNPGFVRLLLPAEAAFDPRTAELTERLIGVWPWWIGMAGFGVPMRRGFTSSAPTSIVAGLSRSFLGVNLGHPHLFAKHVKEALKTVSWYSWVREDLWQLKTSAPLPAPSAEGFPHVRHLPGGVLVKASEFAQLGDVNREESMTGYRHADELLRPVRLTAEEVGGYDGVGGPKNTREWLERFER